VRRSRLSVAIALLVLLAVAAAGCGSKKKSSSSASTGCGKSQLHLLKAGQLTIGTDNPAYPPWYGGSPTKGSTWKVSDPYSGKGFESAVAYALAEQLGFAKNEVKWVVVPFDQSFRPGPKNFDFDINQVEYQPARAKNVDFSSSYFDVHQSLVALKGTELAGAKSLADVKGAKLGVQVGTTSFDYVKKNIPGVNPDVYSNSNDVVAALKAHKVDGIVVDFPTALYVTAVQVPNGVIVGQFAPTGHFGLVFTKGSSLVSCVNKAISDLKTNGTLDRIQSKWISSSSGTTLK
jgi:polar amino acid transport system substrate-binding protein